MPEYPHAKRIPHELLRKNQGNPNEMTDAMFNATVRSLDEEGWMEPIALVPVWDDFHPEQLGDGDDASSLVAPDREPDAYEIVGGHHRADASQVLGHEWVEGWVLDPIKFHRDRRDWSMVKLNITRGAINPEKFAKHYERMAKTYDGEVLQTLMGFTDEDAFRKLYKDARAGLPPELQKALDESKEEIKTIDDLSTVLNKLFGEFGDTLDANYMVFSWGGKEVFWVRADRELWAVLSLVRQRVDRQHLDMTQVSIHALNTWLASAASEPEVIAEVI
jgi:hypothetical protein